jgi:two-component system, OmpR family, response regulator ChvI
MQFHVVLVDDDDLYREAMTADLADHGFAVTAFADGPTCLEALRNGIEVQVALLDWTMPEMSGLQLLGAMREGGIALPVVFLTGSSMVERELQALHRGAVDFVDKTRGTEVLAHRLRVIIEGQRVLSVAPTPDLQLHGNLTLLPSTARALWRQQDLGLTMMEYKIVSLLVSHKGELKTYRALYDAIHYAGFVAGSGECGYRTNVRSMVKRLRRKFLAIDSGFSEIRNVANVGYLWRDPRS